MNKVKPGMRFYSKGTTSVRRGVALTAKAKVLNSSLGHWTCEGECGFDPCDTHDLSNDKAYNMAKPTRQPRTSRCAGKCRHAWCAGYDAGYADGEQDGIDGERERRTS